MDYLRDPATIYARSFEMIRAEADFARIPENARHIATRVIHACGMVEIVDDLIISKDFTPAAMNALQLGAPIFVATAERCFDVVDVEVGGLARDLPSSRRIDGGGIDDQCAGATSRDHALAVGGIVVAVGHDDIFVLCLEKHLVQNRLAAVAFIRMPDVAHREVCEFSEIFYNLASPLVGAVIGDEQLKILERLV